MHVDLELAFSLPLYLHGVGQGAGTERAVFAERHPSQVPEVTEIREGHMQRCCFPLEVA